MCPCSLHVALRALYQPACESRPTPTRSNTGHHSDARPVTQIYRRCARHQTADADADDFESIINQALDYGCPPVSPQMLHQASWPLCHHFPPLLPHWSTQDGARRLQVAMLGLCPDADIPPLLLSHFNAAPSTSAGVQARQSYGCLQFVP